MSAGPGVSRGPLPPLRVRAPAAAAGPQRGALLGLSCWVPCPGAHRPQKAWHLLASEQRPGGDTLRVDHPQSPFLACAAAPPTSADFAFSHAMSLPISYFVVLPCPKACEKMHEKGKPMS